MATNDDVVCEVGLRVKESYGPNGHSLKKGFTDCKRFSVGYVF